MAKKGEIKICVRRGVQVAYGRQAGQAGTGAGLKAWIKTLTAKLASMGLPLLSIAAEKAPDSVAEVTRLYAKGKQA